MKFKVGQRFEVVDAYGCDLDVQSYDDGDIFTIGRIDSDGDLWDDNYDNMILKTEMEDFINKEYLRLLDEDIEAPEEERNNKYLRTITNRQTGESIQVDVYDVLKAFDVKCPCMAHGIKKALVPGQRHSKSAYKDKKEAAWSIEESIKLNNDREV